MMEKKNNCSQFSAGRRAPARGGVLRAFCILAAAVILLTGMAGCGSVLSDIAGNGSRSGAALPNAAKITTGGAVAAAKTYSGNLYCTAEDFVSLREGPDKNTRELAKIPRGKGMRVVGSKKGNWYYVEYGKKTGYVYGDYVGTKAPDPDGGSDPTASTLYSAADDFVALRVSPDKNSQMLIKVVRGEKMTYLNHRVDNWYYVQVNKTWGYVYGDYISAKKPGSGKSTNDPTASILYCIADDYVSLRKSANKNATELVKVNRGEKMSYLDKRTNNWYYVQYGSKKGYVYGDYISAKKPADLILYCTADDFVSLRKGTNKNTTELAKIPRGDAMTYLNRKTNNWYYVQYGSKKGYVYGDYVSTKKPASTTLYCIADDYVSLRSGAHKSYTELVRIPRGGKMTYLNKKTDNWYYVQYGSKKGYVYGDYVSTKKPS